MFVYCKYVCMEINLVNIGEFLLQFLIKFFSSLKGANEGRIFANLESSYRK